MRGTYGSKWEANNRHEMQNKNHSARPLLANTDRSLMNMFNNSTFLAGTNARTRAAAATFAGTMRDFSQQVQARAFDSDGLSQGMPFLWQALDPSVAPYSLTI